MKTWILAMAMMMGFAMNAQSGNRKMDGNRPEKEHHNPFTPAQRAELRAKKLTLALDLNDKQQKEIEKLMLAGATERQQLMTQHKADREAGKKPTQDEHFAMMNRKLDAEIATKKELRKILTAEQFAKYEQLKAKKHDFSKRGMTKFKKERRG